MQSPATPGAILASISAAGDKILYSGVIAMTTPCTTSCISLGGVQWNGIGIAVATRRETLYIAGNDPSATNLPTTTGVLAPNGIGAFVAKVNAGGTGLGYLTYIGSGEVGYPPFANADNTVYKIAVDGTGSAYLAGVTDDPKFPSTPGSYQPASQSPTGTSGFLAKLNPTGSAMVWATYFAGSPQSIAIDVAGNVWVTGTTNPSSTLPNPNGGTTGTEYLARLDASGAKLTDSAAFYPATTIAQSVAVDPSGLVHAAGSAGFVSAIAPLAPEMKIFDFQNAAGGSVTARISPAEVIAIYGPGIGPATAVTATPANGFYPTNARRRTGYRHRREHSSALRLRETRSTRSSKADGAFREVMPPPSASSTGQRSAPIIRRGSSPPHLRRLRR